MPGDYALKVSPSTNASNLTYISSRASPYYRITIPPVENALDNWDHELGIWFETSWDQKAILVKKIKKGKFSFNNTDIRVGDQLLFIDDFPVTMMTFSDAMKLLKERVAEIVVEEQGSDNRNSIFNTSRLKNLARPGLARKRSRLYRSNSQPSYSRLVLSFRTSEECKRMVRNKAFETIDRRDNMDNQMSADFNLFSEATSKQNDDAKSDLFMNVEVKLVNHSLFLYVRPFDTEHPPFKIDNRSRQYLNYRQRGCDGHPWTSVAVSNV